jgi:hypothetical protein
MKVEIKSNINYCLDNRIPKYVTYKVSGDWGLNYNANRITWLREDVGLGTINGDIFYKLCQDIQGSEYEDIISILQSKEIRIENKEYSIQELDIIKSLANVFLWAEYFLLDEYDIEKEDFLPKLFDDFTIDVNNKPTTQKDIYFLPKKYLDTTYSTLISNLMDINLLSELTVVSTNKPVKNHFIPLTKPGYKQDVFQDTDTFQFWKTILNDRHNALNKFFNQR